MGGAGSRDHGGVPEEAGFRALDLEEGSGIQRGGRLSVHLHFEVRQMQLLNTGLACDPRQMTSCTLVYLSKMGDNRRTYLRVIKIR